MSLQHWADHEVWTLAAIAFVGCFGRGNEITPPRLACASDSSSATSTNRRLELPTDLPPFELCESLQAFEIVNSCLNHSNLFPVFAVCLMVSMRERGKQTQIRVSTVNPCSFRVPQSLLKIWGQGNKKCSVGPIQLCIQFDYLLLKTRSQLIFSRVFTYC
jgi:hypothetical protein